jgi:lipoprotein-anchoring transpeptidase ErfK/SrfK
VQQSQQSGSHSINSRHREALLVMTASAALLAGLTASAEALPFNQQPMGQSEAWRPVKAKGTAFTARDKASKKPESEGLAAKAKGVLAVVISIDKQQLTLYSDGHPIAHSRVSTGVPGHPTPTGVFSIIEKDRWHRSNIYYNAPMFYMQRITWSGVAMHQGVVPNGPASHGCIRLPGAFARQMWGITRLGIRVIINHGGDVTPVAFTNERLFTIKLPEPKSEPEAVSTDTGNGAPGSTSLTADTGETTATDAIKSGRPALDAMAYAPGAPRQTAAPDAETVKSTRAALDLPKPHAAKTVATTGSESIKPLKPGPISVFVSLKEGKLFVRKGFEPVFDVPVSFERPDQPLGTHVYTAFGVNDDNTTLRWNVMSMPGGGSEPVKKLGKRSEKVKRAEVPPPPAHASDASDALNRVTIPQEALDRISQLMSPGASLIISDKGVGSETGRGTDFIVLTR